MKSVKLAASSLDPDELLARVIQLFPQQFNYYYAAIYLLDQSGKWAELKEATGETGHVLKQNRYRLEVAGRNMVGAAIREGQRVSLRLPLKKSSAWTILFYLIPALRSPFLCLLEIACWVHSMFNLQKKGILVRK